MLGVTTAIFEVSRREGKMNKKDNKMEKPKTPELTAEQLANAMCRNGHTGEYKVRGTNKDGNPYYQCKGCVRSSVARHRKRARESAITKLENRVAELEKELALANEKNVHAKLVEVFV
jgi:hypothetical protein